MLVTLLSLYLEYSPTVRNTFARRFFPYFGRELPRYFLSPPNRQNSLRKSDSTSSHAMHEHRKRKSDGFSKEFHRIIGACLRPFTACATQMLS